MQVKPCPFCGHEKTRTNIKSPGDQHLVAIRCSKCGARGPIATGPTPKTGVDAAVVLWNAARRKDG